MKEQFDDRIEPYNLGLLSGEALEQFEAEMLTDPKLAEAVREHRTLWEIGELLAEEQLRAQIRERFATPAPKAQTDPKGKFGLLALLLMGVTVFFVWTYRQITRQQPVGPVPGSEVSPPQTPVETAPQAPEIPVSEPKTKAPVPIAKQQKPPTLRALALANYKVPAGLSGIRGGDDDENLRLATKAFFEKDYTQTLDLLKNLPENDYQEALSLRAHAHFGARNFVDALRDFSDLESGGIYRREAQWFVVLSQLAAYPSDNKPALDKLEEILRESRHPYRVNAEKLRQAILHRDN